MTRFKPLLITVILSISASGAANGLDEGLTERKEEARAVTQTLFDELSTELQKAMKNGGPAEAIRVCRDEAPNIKSRLSRETGWQVTRVGTRVRNPLLGMPDGYEVQVLEDFLKQRAEGTPIAELERAEVQDAGNRRYFRYMRGIGVQEQCLSCHGAPEKQPDAIKEQLRSEYPHDDAVGYEVGDLRGAFSVIQDMSKP